MAYEDPAALLARRGLSREDFCQRLLTMLIVGGRYPRWNTPTTPSPAGRRFLDRLHRRSFGGALARDDGLVFVDEFDLPARVATEAGGAPDLAVLTRGRLWLIELNTERTGHRPGQIPEYYDLAHHYHRDRKVDITYVTPTMEVGCEPPGPWARFAHLVWDDVASDIVAVWGATTSAGKRALVDHLLSTVDELDTLTGGAWRVAVRQAVAATATEAVRVGPRRAPPPIEPPAEPVTRALRLASEVAADGQERALDYEPSDLEELQTLRLAVRDILCSSTHLWIRQVTPWLWRLGCDGGDALTGAGAEVGYELRLSRAHGPVP